MATFNKFNVTVLDLAHGNHNLGTDQLAIALTNTLPVAANSVLADLTEIAYTNLSSRNVTTASSSQTGGLYRLFLNDLTLTASGAVATFQYAVLYNTVGSRLLGWANRGTPVTLANGDSLEIQFDQVNGALDLT